MSTCTEQVPVWRVLGVGLVLPRWASPLQPPGVALAGSLGERLSALLPPSLSCKNYFIVIIYTCLLLPASQVCRVLSDLGAPSPLSPPEGLCLPHSSDRTIQLSQLSPKDVNTYSRDLINYSNLTSGPSLPLPTGQAAHFSSAGSCSISGSWTASRVHHTHSCLGGRSRPEACGAHQASSPAPGTCPCVLSGQP